MFVVSFFFIFYSFYYLYLTPVFVRVIYYTQNISRALVKIYQDIGLMYVNRVHIHLRIFKFSPTMF